MTTPALAYQSVSRNQLAADAGVLALVPAASIFDSNGRPEVFPCIRLGEGQELPVDQLDQVDGRYTRIFATFHIWHREPGLAGVKLISGAIRKALRNQRWTLDSYRCIDSRFENARFMRDPDGETSHAVVTIQATLEELSS